MAPALTPVTVTAECAVTVDVRGGLAQPTGVCGRRPAGRGGQGCGRSVAEAVHGAVPGAHVHHPAGVATLVNLLAVPIGADQIGVIAHGAAAVHPPGSAANASRAPSAPVAPGECTAQTTAVEMCGPLDVTTGDPDV